MKAASSAKRIYGETKLLVLSRPNNITHSRVDRLQDFLESGDLLVVNRSATLPSSFRGQVERTKQAVEIRLAAFQGPDVSQLQHWLAFSFGPGDWNIPTEKRGVPPNLRTGDWLVFGEDLIAYIFSVQYERLISIQFISSSLQHNLYKHGRPIQYSYHRKELEIWDQQTIFSGPPISVEPPSSSFPLTWESVFDLQTKGVRLASLVLGAGISSTGNKHLDRMLPMCEWYSIPSETQALVAATKSNGNRIVALGTTVLRALESAALGGPIQAGAGTASIKISPGHEFKCVDTLITGMHEPGTSHREVLNAFCPEDLVRRGYEQVEAHGYRGHEYGDISLLDRGHKAQRWIQRR